MANAFNKEERVAFESILEGFNDALVLSNAVSIYGTDQTMMERTNNTIWRPQPYIARSYSGTDMTSNFGDYTQLSVPATIGFSKAVPWKMSATELRDALQENRLGDAAYQKLASDVNVSVTNVASSSGTVVVSRPSAASGYDDVAEIDAVFNEIGIPMNDRHLALSSRDYNGMASNLSVAPRSFAGQKSVSAYERSLVGDVAGFTTMKLDYANRINPAAGGSSITINTTASGAGQHHTPQATSTAATGEVNNYDNRYQTVTVSSTANVAAGDCFTIAGVNAVHHITKADTGQLKTFRVISVVDGSSMVISPPIISNQDGTPDDASASYKNCEVVTAASNSAITFINYDAANINCFWHKDAIELLPGRYAVPGDAGADVMRGTTDNGIEVVMQKQYDINTMMTKYRLDCLYGVVNKQPEMTGILLFGQTP